MKYTLDYEKYAELARRVAAEGCLCKKGRKCRSSAEPSSSIIRAVRVPEVWSMLHM